MKPNTLPMLLPVALLFVANAAMGQSSDPLPVRSLAASCAACHGTDGRAVQGGPMVALAGYPKDALIAQMKAFRDGSRPSTVMHQIALGFTEPQIETLATYFAARSAENR